VATPCPAFTFAKALPLIGAAWAAAIEMARPPPTKAAIAAILNFVTIDSYSVALKSVPTDKRCGWDWFY
jgi:hypothetical protein